MKKQQYNAETLDRAVVELEREFGMSTSDFYAKYEAGESIPGLSAFEQHVWASFHEDIVRMTEGRGVERGPVMARVNQAYACS